MNFSGTTINSAGTPFTNVGQNEASGEYFIDPDNGLGYWHYLLGDPAAGFAQEVYIRATGASCGQNTICSASAGTTGFGINVLGQHSTTNSSNGTGNPNEVIMRQVLGGTWNAGSSIWTCDTAYCSEFIKSSYANKPKITQGINDPEYTAQFIMDMSAVALSNNSTTLTITSGGVGATGASLTNVHTVIDPSSSNVFSFDMALDGQQTYVNGGKYIYTTGSGVLGASGTYSYIDGNYNPTTIDYSPFLDRTISNPWSFPGAKPP